ncbi:unnamed protein product [marine sediment metagenome]|uniref:Uncharacterized protein n=1 Tax=marine sediment metagenome TaxID=412755 RepID=X1HMA7_9ZZZZ
MLTLEPRATGEQTIQIFLLSEDGTIIEGKTRAVKVTKDIKTRLKKLSSIWQESYLPCLLDNKCFS